MSFLSRHNLQAGIVASLCLHAALLQASLPPASGQTSDESQLSPVFVAHIVKAPEALARLEETTPSRADSINKAQRLQQSAVATAPPEASAADEHSSIDAASSPDQLPVPAASLSRPPVPVTAPAIEQHLAGISGIQWEIRLRLYIDANGQVTDVVNVTELIAPEVSDALSALFRNTLFIPGNDGQRDVASYIDIAITP